MEMEIINTTEIKINNNECKCATINTCESTSTNYLIVLFDSNTDYNQLTSKINKKRSNVISTSCEGQIVNYDNLSFSSIEIFDSGILKVKFILGKTEM